MLGVSVLLPIEPQTRTSSACSICLCRLYTKLRRLKEERHAFEATGDDENRDRVWEEEKGVSRQLTTLLRQYKPQAVWDDLF